MLVVALLMGSTQVAEAQIIDSGQRGGRVGGTPEAWTSLSIGWLQQGGLCDPGSNACWDFGSAMQWRGSLEFPMGRGATIGAMATAARVPLTYSGGGASGCTSCDADGNIYQYMGMLHLGGGGGLHQSIDVAAGATVFTNFRALQGGARLGPGKAVTNLSFAISLGLAYPISPSFQLTLSPEYGLIVGKRMAGINNNNAEQRTIRIGARLALGG
jgi:hypothetical protein